MTNKVFRFTITRPFQKKDPRETRKEIIYSYAPIHNSQFYKDLKQEKDNENRENMIKKAQDYRKTSNFVKNLSDLKMPLSQLDRWLFGRERQIKINDLTAKVKQLFADAGINNWKSWVKGAGYLAELGKVSDSLIACSIGTDKDKDVKNLRPSLMRGIRLAKLLERLANDDKQLEAKDGIATVLRALVLLPKEIFPLPPKDISKEREDVLKSYEKEKKQIEEKRKDLFKLVGQLEKLKNTKLEINKIHKQISKPEREKERESQFKDYEKDFKKVTSQPISARDKKADGKHEFKAKHFTEKESSWILTKNATSKLSGDAKNTLQGIGVDINNVHVRDTTTQIENQITTLSNSLHTATPKSKTVKIGSSFMSKGLMTALKPPGTMLMQPAPGTIDINVPVPSEPPITEKISVPTGKGNVQPIGYSDLFVVREQIKKYEAGEVAHIENILKGERKTREHKRKREKEEVFVIETEEIEETERDLQTSDRFELQTNVEEAMQQTIKADAGVEASYSGINFEIKADAGFSYERATQESSSKARNVTHEVIDRTISHIHERVREERVRRAKEIVEEINYHEINNATNPTGHITGIYRWVDKIYDVEIVNYGRRLMFEFLVPEPAAFFKHAETKTPIEGVTMEKPEPPIYYQAAFNPKKPFAFNLTFLNTEERPLQPEDITEHNYLHWIQKYNVQDVEPPPPQYKIVGIAINEKPEDNSNRVPQAIGEIAVEDGYQAVSAYVGGSFIRGSDRSYMRIAIGKNATQLWGGSREIAMSGEDGKIPIGIMYYWMCAIGLTIEVTCERTPAKMQEWQLKTYTAIMNAYNDLNTRYEDQLRAAQVQAGIAIQGRNPLKNREVERTELKKVAISMITGQHFDAFDAMRKNVSPHGYPQMDLEEATAEGKYIQFFETAFEWHNMTYVFYSYFWGRKENWIDNMHLSDPNDPKFEKFLQAGAARVLVPVRAGYEQAILHYLETESGEIWEGGDPPHVDDDLYVSIVDAIKEDHGHLTIEGKGELSVKKDQTEVIGTGTEFTEEDDENRQIIIKGKTYRISRVEALDRIHLKEKYEDADEDHVPYELGLKFVGEPWEIKIPTSLVWLQPQPDLPDFAE